MAASWHVARRLLGCVVVTLLVAAIASAASPVGVYAAAGRYLDPVFSSVRVVSDVTYGRVTHEDGSIEALKLDLYRPAGDTARNRPVVIYVHGGDSSLDKSLARVALVGKMFARRGFVGVVINYRKGTDGMQPAAASDLQAAVRWVKRNAAALRVSPKRIVVMGQSAGATTALTVTFNSTDTGDNHSNPGYSSAVAAGISMSGMATRHQDISLGEPPIAMIIAKDDEPFYAGTLVTCNETRAYGNVCELFEYESGGHPPPFWIANSTRMIEQLSGFICRNVLGPVVCHDRNGDGRVD